MLGTIDDLYIGQLAKYDGVRVIKEVAAQAEFTFVGHVLGVYENGRFYDFITKSYYDELERGRNGIVQTKGLVCGRKYIKLLLPIDVYHSLYKEDTRLTEELVNNIQKDLMDKGMCFVSKEKERVLRRIK